MPDAKQQHRFGNLFRRVFGFGYDAAETSKRRRSPATDLRSEDETLKERKRRKLTSNARDLYRNFEIVPWAVGKHLDFVAEHSFQCRVPDAGLRRDVEALIAERSKRENFDSAGRHSRERFTRLIEGRRTIDGDLITIKLRGGYSQCIEADRIRDPERSQTQSRAGRGGLEYRQGFAVDRWGRLRAAAVHRRVQAGYEFQRHVPAEHFFHFGYFDRLAEDQTRGVGKLATAINRFRDMYEGADYALAKMKISQLFGLVIYSDAADGVGTHTTTQEGDTASGDKYDCEPGKGPFKLELDGGDKAEFLESKTPSAEFKAFLEFCLSVALKSLDLPLSMFDEARTNFFGSRAALILYLKSCLAKRRDVVEWLDDWTRWQLDLAVGSGELVLPRGVDSLGYSWIPDGVPWWNPAQEVAADIRAIAAGFKTRGMVTMERYGRELTDVLDELEFEEDEIRRRRINISEAEVLELVSGGAERTQQTSGRALRSQFLWRLAC